MEEVISQMKLFLKSFNEQIQSPTSEELPSVRVANYSLELEEIPGQVIDWIVNYLENCSSKCPYPLAVVIAKEAAHQVSASFAAVASSASEEEIEKYSNASNLYAEAIGKLSEICSSLLENNKFLDQINQNCLNSQKYATSVFAIKNKRRKMEDRHVVHHDLNALLDLKDVPQHSFYAVFDGHAGADAACYSSAQLHINIAKNPQFLLDTPRAIIEGYEITDLNFLNKCNKEHMKSGCTVVSALVRENTLYLSWCGDSQAVLVKEGLPVIVTSPHKPEREDERARIESLGGKIVHQGIWRVNGFLGVTRAIGDPDQKEFISCEPELTVINLDGSEDFLILACDGMWDVMSPDDVTAVLYHYLIDSSPNERLDSVAAKLVHQSKLQGSEDNITAIVIYLRNAEIIKENAAKFMTNASLAVQCQDFLSMNGNTQSATDVPFTKPTVLELNATSTKKLKNAANVMNSAGFGDSFSYQFVENSMTASFQKTDASFKEHQDALTLHQKVPAACFAPEATALSELPTPPIDDMLASQKCDNFHDTDLYKEINNSVKAGQNSNEVDDIVDVNSNEPNVCAVHVTSKSVEGGIHLTNDQTNLLTQPGSDVSPEEAVGIASAVVSTTIETAVKCIAEDTTNPVPVQSPIKLNPYAKPFVMKSYFSSEDTSNLSATITDNSVSTNPIEHITDFGNQLKTQSSESKVDENIKAVKVTESVDNLVFDNKTDLKGTKGDFQSSVGNVFTETTVHEVLIPHMTNNTLVIEDAVPQDTLVTAASPEKEMYNNLEVCADRVTEQDNADCLSNLASDQVLQNNVMNRNFMNNSTPQSSPEKIPTPVLENNLMMMSEQDLVSEASTLEDITSSLSHDFENLNLNTSVNAASGNLADDQIAESMSTPMLDQNIDVGFVSDANENDIVEVTTPVATNSGGTNISEQKQNIEIYKTSDDLLPNMNENKLQNTESEAMVFGDKKKETSEFPGPLFLEKISKEPISLVTITNELVSTSTEMPSDPSVEDSHVEPVAVDLKSLPENIPEAEGVTEDVDSDSEKDGGWSYMKGNTLSGSKPKSVDKTSKSAKSATMKTASSNVKKDVPKLNLDSRSKVKSSITHQSKVASSADKITVRSVDKTKPLAASDKMRTATANRIKSATPASRVGGVTAIKKDEPKGLKSSTLPSTKVSSLKTVHNANAVARKGNLETGPKITSAKPSRPTTLLHTAKAAATDKNTASNKARPIPTIPPKAKTTILEKKTDVKTSTSTNIERKLPPVHSRTTATTSTVHSVTARKTVAQAEKSNINRPTMQYRSAVADSKPKQPTSTLPKRPITSTAKKTDVKEAKDNVNNWISARKNIAVPKTQSSSTNKRMTTLNSRSAVSKMPTDAAKPNVSKKNLQKTLSSKGAKSTNSKVVQNVAKAEEENVLIETGAVKNTLNLEMEQKNLSEIVPDMEKYNLETDNKEIVSKENAVDSIENKEVTGSPAEVPEKFPVTEENAQVDECTNISHVNM